MAESTGAYQFPLGHQENRRRLSRLAAEGGSSGSYLFSGMESLGKKLTALWFACLLNCREDSPPCGKCRSCRLILSGLHPDVFIVEKDADKKVITIDQVRKTVVEGILYKPFEGRFRVFIVDDAHLMNEQAQNAMLKVLEEPGNLVVIILVTSRPNELLPTIGSRCRKFRFFPLPADQMALILQDRSGVCADPSRNEVIEACSGGVPGRALRLTEDEGYWKGRKALYDLLSEIHRSHLEDILSFSGSFKAGYSDVAYLESTFEILMAWLRDLLCLQAGMDQRGLLNADYSEALRMGAPAYDAAELVEIQSLVLEVRKLVLENNLNIKMALQRILIRIRQAGALSYKL